jgi:hypothetical protein
VAAVLALQSRFFTGAFISEARYYEQVRLRYFVAIWITGSLIAGFSLGSIIERHRLLQVLNGSHVESVHKIMNVPQKVAEPKEAPIGPDKRC